MIVEVGHKAQTVATLAGLRLAEQRVRSAEPHFRSQHGPGTYVFAAMWALGLKGLNDH